MLQNSLDRLFEGMAAALRERVLPAVDDGAAAAQVRAAIELLGNLSTRVTWDPGYLLEIRERVRPALVTVRAAGAPVAEVDAVLAQPIPDPGDAAGLHRDVVAHLDALGLAEGWMATTPRVGEDLRAAVDRFVDWHLAAEMQRLRSASFGAGRGGAPTNRLVE